MINFRIVIHRYCVAVFCILAINNNQLRAQGQRTRGGHGRSHPEFTGFVTGGGNDAASFRATPDGYRLPRKTRILTQFHRRVEGVCVDMDDFADGVSRAQEPAPWA